MSLYSIVDRYTELRRSVRERLRKVNSMTERGVLEAGQHLNRVVETAQAHISRLRERLATTTESGLHRAIAGQVEHVKRNSATLDNAVASHAKEVAEVAAAAREITEAAREIERANSAARVLSINARIEAARSGAETFKAIAIELHELSRTIVSANGRIQQLATAMEVTLPHLTEQAGALRQQVAEYMSTSRAQIATIDEEVVTLRASVGEALSSSDRALATIIDASHAGLSALQFQDVCAQSLLQIDGWQGDTLRAIAAEERLDIEVEAGPVAVSQEDGITDRTNAGEVLLF